MNAEQQVAHFYCCDVWFSDVGCKWRQVVKNFNRGVLEEGSG